MNQELFDSMQKQMTPSPEVRAALSEKLAQPVKKRPVPWMKYGAVAACAALVIGAFSVYQLQQPHLLSEHREVQLHSYVTVEGTTDQFYVAENTIVDDKGSGGENYSTGVIDRDEEVYTGAVLDHTQSHNTGDLPNRDTAPSGALPGGAYVGDVPVQAGAEDYQKLMDRFNGQYPDWYGGAYINDSGWLVVQLVEDKDPADKSLELQVLDWVGSDTVMFSSCKYSLARLNELMDQLNALPDTDPVCRNVMAGWGVDEEANRIELTLTEVNDHVLAILAELDPDDDAIYVQVGQRTSAVDDLSEDPAVHHVVPGGAAVPDDEDLIADEPLYEGAHYDLDHLPEELPQEKCPAITVDSVPEEDASTASWFPED